MAALVVIALAMFFWQRSRSTFLRIEAERPAAHQLSVRHRLPLADVFALRDLVGIEAPPATWQAAVAYYAEHRDEAGDLAAVAAFAGEGQPRAADAPEPIAARRFELMRARFAERLAARH